MTPVIRRVQNGPRLERASMPRAALALAWGLAFPLATAAFMTLIGVGMARRASPPWVSVGAVVLVVLPALGLGSLVPHRRRAFPFALAAWSLALLWGFPVYFPGERTEAMLTGLGVIGFGHAVPDEMTARAVEQVLPAEPKAQPPPVLAAENVADLPPSAATRTEQVVLPYEGDERSLRVPVNFESGGRDVDATMLFDTGATFTTLDAATLEKLGVKVPESAPEVSLHTAGGDRSARLVLVDRAWVAGLAVDGVTISVCEECSDGDARGLLGLNVSGQFLFTVDTARHELLLEARRGAADRRLDVGPWVELQGTATHWPDGRVEVDVSLHNRAPRGIEGAAVAISCDREVTAEIGSVPAGETGTTRVRLPRDLRCDRYGLSLERARWAK